MTTFQILAPSYKPVIDISPANGYIVSMNQQTGDTVNIGSSPIAGGVGATVTTMSIPSKNLDFVGAVAYGDRAKKEALAAALYPRREVIVRATTEGSRYYDAHGFVAVSPAFNGYGFAFSIFCDTGAWEEALATGKELPKNGEFSTGCSLPVDFEVLVSKTPVRSVKMQLTPAGSNISGSVKCTFDAITDSPIRIHKQNGSWKAEAGGKTYTMVQEGYVQKLHPENSLYISDAEDFPFDHPEIVISYHKAWGSVI